MTLTGVAEAVDQYLAGIEAELHLLRQLEELATRQRDVTAARNLQAFGAPSAERDRITQALLTLEESLRPLRRVLADEREAARQLPHFWKIDALHAEASDLVARIHATDRDSFKALADADLARRAALAGLDHGEATLAAYRRVLAPPPGGSNLINQRG